MNKLIMKPHSTDGKLITFCGLDGCGKSSMIKMTTQLFIENGIDFVVTKQPTDTIRKSEIFRTFMDCPDNNAYEYRSLSLIAAADRIQHTREIILPALKSGKIVICDRYFYSCLANLRARGYIQDEWIYEISTYIVKPDVAFFLDVPVETAINRVRMRPSERKRYIDIPLQHRLKNEYREICNTNNGVLVNSANDVAKTFDIVKNRIYQLLGNNYNLGEKNGHQNN